MFMDDTAKLKELVCGKNVLYISTKNIDYIRTNQEIHMLKEFSEDCKVIAFNDRSYMVRFLKCIRSVLFISMKQFDLVFVGFMAQMLVPFFWWKWNKQVIITDFFISVFDTLVDDRKKVSESSLVGKLIKRVDKRTIAKSDYIVTDTIAHKEYFINELSAEKKQCLVIYLCADKRIYYPRKIEKPEEYKNKFVVLYFGSILPLQGVEYVLGAIRVLEKRKDIQFIMIGPLEGKFKKVVSENVTYINWLSQEELARYIGFSDLCLGGHFEPNIGKANRTIPGKVYIYEAMGKKTILGDSLANHELFVCDGKHQFVKMGDSNAIADCIVNNINEREHCRQYES